MKNLKIIIAVFLVVLTVFGWISYISTSSSDLIEYNDNLKQAEEWTEKGLYYRAIDCYAEALKYKPTEENWSGLLDVCKLNCEEYPEFKADYIDYLEDAVSQYPKNVAFVYDLAMAYYDDESYKNAYKTATNSIDNGVKDEKIITLARNLKYVYRLKGSTFTEFYSPIENEYSVHGKSGWGKLDTEGASSNVWEYLYYGPIGENGEKIISSGDLGVRLYDENDKVLAKFDFNIASAGRFSEGLIAIQSEDLSYAYYDEYGEKKFGDFEEAGTFYDGLAAVKQNGKWGIINTKGEFTVSPEYDEIVLDNYGYFNKQKVIAAGKNNKYGLYDDSFKRIGDFEADKIGIPTDDNMFAFCSSGKWGFVDDKGKILIEASYDDALSFSNGLAAICIDGEWGFIDTSNNIVIQCEFAGADYFNSEGSCCVRIDAPNNEEDSPEWSLLVLEMGLNS